MNTKCLPNDSGGSFRNNEGKGSFDIELKPSIPLDDEYSKCLELFSFNW